MSAKTWALVLGIILVLVGLLGFVSNPLVGMAGLFMTNAALDIVYIILGAILVVVSQWSSENSALWLKIVGVIYLILAILGFVMIPGGGTMFGLMADMATHWLHVVVGVVLLAAGFWAKEGMGGMAMPPAAM